MRIDGVTLHLHGLPSPYWGQDQVVTGLLTGQDLIEGWRISRSAMSCCFRR